LHEILSLLAAEDQVLDLGSRSGSFAADSTLAQVVRLDLDKGPGAGFVQGDARSLPFRDGCFAAVVANHSLEHVEGLEACLDEIGRVLRPGSGLLYVAVPDACTLSDGVYRWLSHGGGHVNAIQDGAAFGLELQKRTGLNCVGTRLLHTSFAFANTSGANRWSRRIYLLGGGKEWALRLASIVFRRCDAWFGTRWSVYGWAFYLGQMEHPDEVASGNVCIRCGSAHVSEWLLALGIVKRHWLLDAYACPQCSALNYFTPDAKRPV
jgi:SAM-dependent methyltransferase